MNVKTDDILKCEFCSKIGADYYLYKQMKICFDCWVSQNDKLEEGIKGSWE